MTKNLRIVILMGVLLSLAIGGQLMGQARGGRGQTSDTGAVGLFVGTNSDGNSGFIATGPTAIHIKADQITYEVGTTEADGNVSVTLVLTDGSTVILSADHMTLKKGRQRWGDR